MGKIDLAAIRYYLPARLHPHGTGAYPTPEECAGYLTLARKTCFGVITLHCPVAECAYHTLWALPAPEIYEHHAAWVAAHPTEWAQILRMRLGDVPENI